MRRLTTRGGTAGTLRGALAFLVALGVLGTALTLAYDRHWGEFWQLVPWATLVLVSLALAALIFRATRKTVRFVQIIAVLTVVSAVLGTWQHYDENYNTAPLDALYTDRWDTMTLGERWWAVANGDVGHVPVPAAAVLVPLGIALWMTTIGLGSQRQVDAGAVRIYPDGGEVGPMKTPTR